LLANIERSRLGRAWIALREDELAGVSMGINATRVRLSAFVLCAAIAGLGGSLFAFVNNGTTDPKNTFDFGHSVIVLACVILGGMGNRLGVLLGVLLILGFDQIILPWVDDRIPSGSIFQMKNWKLMIYGMSLILMMRFRPEGILPEQRIAHELHPEEEAN
jgi:branched-chain amino acid transport system permease protein